MSSITPLFPDVEIQDGHDLTPFVERQQELEDLCGVKIGSISAWKRPVDWDGETRVRILAEVSSFIGHTLSAHLFVQAIVYNDAGRMIGQYTDTIYATGYRGLIATDMTLFCRGNPARIVLFPHH